MITYLRKNLNLKQKMIFAIVPALLVVFAVSGGSAYLYFKNILEQESQNEASLIAKDFASQLETEFAVYFNVEKQFNTVLSRFEEIDVNLRRKFYTDLSRDFLEKNEKILAFWVDFDKNAFDGQDDNYKSVGIFPRSGRFNFAWQRMSGKVEAEIEVPEELVETLLDMPYYALPRQQGRTVMIEPYYDNYTGTLKEGGGFLMTSIVSPIFNKNNKIVGVSGIDISLDNYVKFTEKIKPFEVGYASLYSPKGNYLSHPNRTLFGKTVLKNPIYSTTLADSIHKLILSRKKFTIDHINNENGKRALIYFIPINTGIIGEELTLSVYVPYEVLLTKINDLLFQLIIITVSTLTLIIIIIVIVSKKIIDPLKKLSIEAEKLTRGDISLHLDIDTNDEVGELSKIISFFSQTVKELVDEVNTLTISAIEGRLDTRGNAKKFKGVYYSLVEGINKAMDAFVEPIDMAMNFIQAVANGTENIEIVNKEYKGSYNKLKEAINDTNNCLHNFKKNIEILNEAAMAGDLSKRADVSLFKGNWLIMIGGINNIVAIFADLIEESSSVLNTMATGDLTPRINKQYTGKFEAMKEDINNLGNSLTDLISEIKQSVDITADSSEQITSTAKILSEATLRQSKNTIGVASAIEQMSNIVETNAKNATKTADVANNSGKIAQSGQKVVQQTINKMREIAEVVKASAENIQKLGDSSNKIGEIVTVINNIAEQTNLLSLNAAIEAARAGEQGRGFAVVADSVRKLSVSTAEATKQISDMIRTIQEDTDNAVQAMEKGTIEVNDGIALADKAGTSLSNILNSINELLGMINHIADASQQQAETSETIAKNIEIIKNDTDTSSKNVEEVASNSSELLELTTNLSKVMRNFKTDANMANRRLN